MYWWLLQHLVVVIGLAIAVLAIGRITRLSPALRNALWVIVLIKLMTPPLVAWPWTLPAYGTPGVEGSRGVETVVVEDIALPKAHPAIVRHTAATPAPRVEAPEQSKNLATAIAWTQQHHQRIVFVIWIAGSVSVFGLYAYWLLRYRRNVATRLSPPEWLTNETRALAARIGVTPPDLFVVDGLHSPLVHHFGRAVLLIPTALLDFIPRERWQCIIAHELAHLRRRDHLVRWLELFAACVWWWNPVFWLIRRNLRDTAEQACDVYVVHTLPDSRRAYAETLIDVSELIGHAGAPLSALGVRSGVRMDFERRLTQILHGSASPRLGLRTVAVLALLLALVLPAWTQVNPLPTGKPAAQSPPSTALPPSVSATPSKVPVESKIETALNTLVSIEFKNEHLANIVEFLAEYVGVNIAIDWHAVAPMPTHAPGEQPAPLDPSIAKLYATDGMVPSIKLEDIALKDALFALLKPLNLQYEPHKEFIWITLPGLAGNQRFDDPAPGREELNEALDMPISIEFQEEHISEIADFIAEQLNVNIVIDKRAIQPAKSNDNLDSQLGQAQSRATIQQIPAKNKPDVPTDNVSKESQSIAQTPVEAPTGQRKNVTEYWTKDGNRMVQTGYLPYVKFEDVSAREVLKALLIPLNLYYKLGPGFIYISTPELLAKTNFTESPTEVPKEVPNKSEATLRRLKINAGEFPAIEIDGFITLKNDNKVALRNKDGAVGLYGVGDTIEGYELTAIDADKHSITIRKDGLSTLLLPQGNPDPEKPNDKNASEIVDRAKLRVSDAASDTAENPLLPSPGATAADRRPISV